MAFTSKPGTPLKRSKPLQAKSAMSSGKDFAKSSPSPSEQRTEQQASLQRATLRALEKARRDAETAGVDLSQWETEFIDSVAQRVQTYGRAFADPDKGAMNGTLSLRQGVKLKEIRKKVRKAGSDAAT